MLLCGYYDKNDFSVNFINVAQIPGALCKLSYQEIIEKFIKK